MYNGSMAFLQELFKKKDMSALGIDIGSSSIKVVQLKKKGDKAILDCRRARFVFPQALAEPADPARHLQ